MTYNRTECVANAFVGHNQPVAESLMIPLAVIVSTELRYGAPHHLLTTKENHSVKALVFDRPDETFGERIQIRRSCRQRQRFHAGVPESRSELRGVFPVTVHDQISLATQESVLVIDEMDATRQLPDDECESFEAEFAWRGTLNERRGTLIDADLRSFFGISVD
jgi:hypothetical protein